MGPGCSSADGSSDLSNARLEGLQMQAGCALLCGTKALPLLLLPL